MREIAEQVFNEKMNKSQYAVSAVPFHTHNNIDSTNFPFLNLSDVPKTYNGHAGEGLIVKTTENGLEFGSSGSVVYAGYINSGGTAGSLPVGWSSSKTGTGQYTLTHNLGTANYSCLANAAFAGAFMKFNAINTNDVQFVFLDHNANLTDTRFYFILAFFN